MQNLYYSPVGNSQCGTIDTGPARSTYCSFLLPEICSLPLGLVWPTNIGFGTFKESIKALGLSYKPFLYILTALELQFEELVSRCLCSSRKLLDTILSILGGNGTSLSFAH
jgi:hypothetical protein